MPFPAPSKQKNQHTFYFLGTVMLINALSYGTIIPLFYPYAEKFGLGPMGVSLLFASFSLAQFIATPIIGKMSDKYGRRPMLLFSLLGTSLSLALFALANTTWMLFVARILDGITGGNISVAQAVISDSVEPKQRAQAFGMLGASFGFGFLLGPALGGILSQYDLTAPFWMASFLALLATVVGFFILPETIDPDHMRHATSNPVDPRVLLAVVRRSGVGLVLMASFLVSISFNAFVIAFQTFTNVTLGMSPRDIGLLFSLVGLVSIIMQGFGVGMLQKLFKSRSKLIFSAELSTAFFLLLMATPLAYSLAMFIGILIIFQITNAPLGPLITGMLTEKAESHEQGEVLGVNQSFVSVAQVIGPLVAGVAISLSAGAGFIMASIFMLCGFVASFLGYRSAKRHAELS